MTGFGSRYRSAALLIALVCLGWAWDFALGGGTVHAPAWLAALFVVAGIGLLTARAGKPAPAATNTSLGTTAAAQPHQPAQAILVRPAVADELPVLVEVEVAADKLFELAGYGRTPGPASIEELAGARLLLVAVPQATAQPAGAKPSPAPAPEEPPIGYVRVEVVDGHAHIEGLSVRPKWMRQGVGTALVSAACQWAAEQGFDQITLCTCAEVPWNGPFYAQQGFREDPVLTAELQALREREERSGLDAMGRRCVMRKSLVTAAVAEKLPTEQVGKH